MKMLDRKNVFICFPVRVPDEILSQGKAKACQWIKEYMYELATSNDGSEILANMKIDVNTTIFPNDARVVSSNTIEGSVGENVEVLLPVLGDHPTLVSINLAERTATFEGYD